MEIYPVKAQYLKNEEVLIHLEFDGTSAEQVFITVYRLEQVAGEFNFQDLTDSADLPIGSFSDDFAGYGVVARVISGGASTSLSTAFDVVDNPKRSLRYGFLSDFTAADKDNGAVETLRKYHINMVQFYDWSYRHDFLVSEESEYTDMMGKRINTEAVRTKSWECTPLLTELSMRQASPSTMLTRIGVCITPTKTLLCSLMCSIS